jgi:hypothetical protein
MALPVCAVPTTIPLAIELAALFVLITLLIKFLFTIVLFAPVSNDIPAIPTDAVV